MGLIRSLLVRLGMDSANFDSGAKRAQNSLYGLTASIQRQSQAWGTMRQAAIGIKISTAAVEGFTEWYKAAERGASNMEILESGIKGLVYNIPLVGNLAKAFEKLSDEISGTARAAEAAKAAWTYAQKSKVGMDEAKFRIGILNAPDKYATENLTIEKNYQTQMVQINKEANEAEPALNRIRQLQQEIADMSKETEKRKYMFGGESFFDELHKKEDELADLQQKTKIDFAERRAAAIEERDLSLANVRWGKMGDHIIEDAEKTQQSAEKFIQESKNKKAVWAAEIKHAEEAQRHIEEMAQLSARYDTDRMKVEKAYQELERRRGEIGEAAFGRGEESLKRRLLESEYTRMQNPSGEGINPYYVDVKALSESQKDILVEKQMNVVTKEEQVLIKWDKIANKFEQGPGIS
jgi:hypothetical protein